MSEIMRTPWGVDVTVNVRPETQDWNTLYSCLVEDEYHVHNVPSGSVCVDIGAHVGGVTLALLSKGCTVISVEALPENFAQMAEHVSLNGWQDRWDGHNKAIGHSDGDTVTIAYGDYEDCGTEFAHAHRFIGVEIHHVEPGQHVHHAPTISLATLLASHDRIEYLKIDCEGGEWQAFGPAPRTTLDKLNTIAAELHPVLGQTAGMDLWDEFGGYLGADFHDVTSAVFGHPADRFQTGLACFIRSSS